MNFSDKKYLKWFFALIIIVVASLVSVKIIFPGFLEISKEKELNPFPKGVIALVNGQEIKGGVFNDRFNQIKNVYLGEEDLIDEVLLGELKDFALREVINEFLIMEYAEREGIFVDQEEVDFHYNEIERSVLRQEDFEEELKKWGFTTKTFKEEILKQLIIERAINLYADDSLEVSEEDMRDVFDEYNEQSEGMLDYDEVKDDLRAMLERDKFAMAAETLIDQLRLESEIEVLFN